MQNSESASSEAATTSKRHYIIALAVSLVLSLLFWAAFGVFEIVGFVLWTSISALLGSSIGLVSDRKLWVTVIATTLIRTMIFVISWFIA